MVLIMNEYGLEQLLDVAEIARICEGVLAREGVGVATEISVTFVDDDEMQRLNRSWRGIDRVTDVLSFECDSPFDEDLVRSLPEGESVELGDIVIDPVQIARQAPGFGNSAEDECRLMLVHGLLHLLGYDHIDEADAVVMEGLEDEILRELAGGGGSTVAVAPTTNHAHD